MPSATVTSKGQVTIPKSIRQALKVGAGDRVDFVMEGEGRIVVRAGMTGVSDLKGFLHRPGRRPVSIGEMNAAIARQGRLRS
jgi:AbrB family looped-hinge helix DNA binding protein